MHNVKINFTGDISFTGSFKQKVTKNIEIFDTEIKKIFSDADLNIINLEGPTTDNTNFFRNGGKVVSPYCSIEYLTKRNIRNFNLANNHTFDNGISGFRDTKKGIEENGGSFFGAGENIEEASKPLLLRRNGIKIAMIGVAHKEGMLASKKSSGVFCSKSNLFKIKKLLKELKNKNDWVILNYHGGEEYTTIPMPSRKRFLRKLSKFDCDLIIAHHPHVFQGYEKYNGKYIFYSLGNFVFDIPQHKNIQFIDKTGILSFNFTKESLEFTVIPVNIDAELGLLKRSSDDFIETVNVLSSKIDHPKYFRFWIKDAYRTFFKSNRNKKGQHDQIARRHKSVFQLIRDVDAFKRLLFLLLSPNKRPIIFGAFLFKISKKLGIINEKP